MIFGGKFEKPHTSQVKSYLHLVDLDYFVECINVVDNGSSLLEELAINIFPIPIENPDMYQYPCFVIENDTYWVLGEFSLKKMEFTEDEYRKFTFRGSFLREYYSYSWIRVSEYKFDLD